MGQAERRSHDRVSEQRPVRVRTPAGREFDATIENMGPLGAFVSTPDLDAVLEAGDRVTLVYEEDGAERTVDGEVLRLEQEFADGDIKRAFAVRFDAAP